MNRFGLIGFPLSHSFSPAFFARKFKAEGIAATYETFPLEDIADFPALLQRETGLAGLNVTIPHKQAVIPYLDELDQEAAAIGAVNTISFERAGNRVIRKGWNTDVIGFRDSLYPLLQPHHQQALILGTGGAAKAVRTGLEPAVSRVRSLSRTASQGTISYEAVTPELIREFTLLINTTPLGMHPHTEAAPPLPYHAIGPKHLLYDLIYNPLETRFLAEGKARGASIKNGLEMLERQAEAAWEIWQRIP